MNRRQTEIVELLGENAELRVGDLAARFAVSLMTIRRDLVLLERLGHLTRTHGGAIPSRKGVIEFSFEDRQRRNADLKRQIAAAVAAMVHPGMTLTLDTGTTTLEVARAISSVGALTVLTSSLAIASVLHARENVELVLLGGAVRKNSPDLSGPLTEENIGRFRVNMAVVGADAAGPDGLFTTDANVARVTKAMIDAAEVRVLAADHTKFETTALVRYAVWDDIDRVVTDSGAGDAVRRWLEKSVGEVVYAGQSQTLRGE